MNPATSLASRFHLTLDIDIDRLLDRRHFARKTRQELDSTEYEDVGIYEVERLFSIFAWEYRDYGNYIWGLRL